MRQNNKILNSPKFYAVYIIKEGMTEKKNVTDIWDV